MGERPILFSGPMVRAILSGTKTQTRRVVPPGWQVEDVDRPEWWGPARLVHAPHCRRQVCEQIDDAALACGGYELAPRRPQLSPFGAPGDRLWVRETFVYRHKHDRYYYRADHPIYDPYAHNGWRSPLFMPRRASRITLELVSVRVERLQEISEADARAEGIEDSAPFTYGFKNYGETELPGESLEYFASARESFESLWDSLNAKRAPWASNPWVWAIEFKRVTP